ncbi:hypothetical protein DMH03_07375 [Amycolatopsis sp. WAC 01376]|uniref:ESX secretion-associated protein EspG n=1 Tax=Amycolatopsis sp. WAC 01376 TaxID=2203195 RepID=UPI000F774985|nr:ESX secretion-associated protein EspG [Amycolatopsis sp. WAC 01376]RSM66891.1 hypothetical protein DMH03_07375 [Amycolatopsis sp. WAC 01376]
MREPATVKELMKRAAEPVLRAVPERRSVYLGYDPEITDDEIRRLCPSYDGPADLVTQAERYAAKAAMLEEAGLMENGEIHPAAVRMHGVMLRGSVRGVLTGVFASAPRAVRVDCYGDGHQAVVWRMRSGRRTTFSLSDFGELGARVFGGLPHVPAGDTELMRIRIDEHGVPLPGQDEEVGLVGDTLNRPRTGTAILDLVAFGGLNAEYPDYGFVIIDNDLGRFVLYAAPSEGWLMFGGMDRRALAGWLHEAVDLSRT